MSVGVKICGIRSAEIMRAAVDAGADFVGLAFFANSPRNVSLAEAAALADIARGRATIVALMVDADDAAIDAIVRAVQPDILQLHGSETPERCAVIKARWATPIMKALGVASVADAERSLAYLAAADLILFDAKPPKGAVLPGGNGIAFDWSIIAPMTDRVPAMLSGGLTPANVAEAIRIAQVSAVDVSSGVETEPGVKDAALIRAFVNAAKTAHRPA